MSRVSISPTLLSWARERAGMDSDVLLEAFPRYSEWESGEAKPTLKQLEKLAKKTSTPLGFFFLSQPPVEKLPVTDFRTMTDQSVRRPSPNLLDTIHTMEQRQSWMKEYLLERGVEPLPFIGSTTIRSNIEVVADQIRETLQLSRNWAEGLKTRDEALRHFKSTVSEAGIMLFSNGVVGTNTRRRLDPEEFRGFVLCDPIAPLIFLNNTDAQSARLFTLAHELAHLWVGEGGVFNLPQLLPSDHKVEIFCNAVAAEFLLPAAEFERVWQRMQHADDPFLALSNQFKVSQIVAARRALDLGRIKKAEFFHYYEETMTAFRKRKAKQAGGGDYYRTQGSRLDSRFAAAVHQSVSNGTLPYSRAYRLTGMQGKTFDQFFSG